MVRIESIILTARIMKQGEKGNDSRVRTRQRCEAESVIEYTRPMTNPVQSIWSERVAVEDGIKERHDSAIVVCGQSMLNGAAQRRGWWQCKIDRLMLPRGNADGRVWAWVH